MIKGGPKIINDSLVACLDAHDAKSYAGEPITNMAYNIGILGQGSTWEAITSVPGSEGQTGPGSNVNFKKLNDNSVANTFLNSNGKIFRNYVNNPATSDSSSFNNNGGFRYASSINLTSGGASGYVIISFWCYLVTGYQGYGVNGLASAYMQFQDSGGTYTGNGSLSRFVDGVSKSAPETFNADTGRWKFVQLRFTKPANSTAIRNFYIYADKNTQGEMYVCQLQIEDRSDGGFYQVPFVEGASSRSATDGWKDLSTNDHDGSLLNGTNTGVNYYRDGQVIMPVANSYLDFDGSDDHVKIDHSTQLNNAKTWEIWINIDSFPASSTYDSVFQKSANWNNFGGILLSMIYGHLRFSYGGYWADLSIEQLSNMNTGTWYQVVGTGQFLGAGSGVLMKGYLNGVYKNSLTRTEAFVPTNSNALYLGDGSGGTMNGKIGLFRVYEDILTAAEILSNYNATKNRFT